MRQSTQEKLGKGGLLSLEQAVELLFRYTVSAAQREIEPLGKALGRICAADLCASLEQPPFDRSPLDGYAVRRGDLEGACPERPVELEVVQKIFAGDRPTGRLEPGTCARIMTGAPIPEGADCVVRQEDTDYGEKRVKVLHGPGRQSNICNRGEDLRRGAPIVSAGERLTAAHLGVLAGQGVMQVPVYPLLQVGVLSTGDELAGPGDVLCPGKIYDSNGAYLSARLCELGMEPTAVRCSSDDEHQVARSIQTLLECCDAVVTVGGVSVGQRDPLPRTAKLLGGEVLFHGVGVRPGSPMMAMLVDGKPVISLSGNPFAAAATLEAAVRPVLCRMAGWRDPLPQRRTAVLTGDLPKASPVRRLVRAVLHGTHVLPALGCHESGALSAMIGCNCLIDLPAGTPALTAGAEVEVLLL